MSISPLPQPGSYFEPNKLPRVSVAQKGNSYVARAVWGDYTIQQIAADEQTARDWCRIVRKLPLEQAVARFGTIKGDTK